MRVLLIQPPLEDFYTTPIRLYPLGLLYAAGVFREAGWDVRILDCLSPLRKRRLSVPKELGYLEAYLQNPYFFKGYYHFGISEPEVISRIRTFAPDLIGISSQFTAYYQSTEELVRLIKKHAEARVMIGGNHATVFAKEIRERTPEVDAVLIGPAEDCIPGYLASQRLSRDFDRLDWKTLRPAHDLVPSESYKIGRKNYVSLTASRGCPYECDFCGIHKMFGRKIEYRPIESVIEEMRWNYTHKCVRIFNFEDDNLSFDRRWFLDFLNALTQDSGLRGIELTAMNGICYPTLDEEILEAMRRAGFRQLNLSLVSRNEALRAGHVRPRDSGNFESLIRKARELGFFVTVYVIIGLPGQTYDEAKRTIDYLLSLGVLVGPSVFYLSPGSRLYDEIDVSPEIKNNWNLYRSSAFAVETKELSRAQLLDLFFYVRKRNLNSRAACDNKIGKNRGMKE